MSDHPVGKRHKVEEHHWVHGLMGVPQGEYEVYVGDYGWDNGDIYIRDLENKKWPLRDIKEE